VQPPIEPQHANARAVIEGGVLEGPSASNLHELHVNLDRFPWLSLLEELQLARHALTGPTQARQADVSKDPLDRAHGNPHIVNAPEPELRALSAIFELTASLSD
jgi:hypothetical protein